MNFNDHELFLLRGALLETIARIEKEKQDSPHSQIIMACNDVLKELRGVLDRLT